jgi:hypothetical protein
VKNLRICVKHGESVRSLAWISLQNDGAVSVGFTDKSIRVQDSQQPDSPRTLVNPHFTLHPPGYWHLRSEGESAMWSGLVWTTHLPDAECSPWLRFVSMPVDTLPVFKGVSHGKKAETWPLVVNDVCSIGVLIDFVNSAPLAPRSDSIARYVVWGELTLRVRAQRLPPQQGSLGYNIMG